MMKVGDKIRIKTIHDRGLLPDTYKRNGDVYIIKKLTMLEIAKCFEIDCISVITGNHFNLTEKYYEIEVLFDYVPIELPKELFEI